MNRWKLYVILDKALAQDKDLAKLAEEVIVGGADVIQLRDKISSGKVFLEDALAISTVAKRHKIPFIINDRPDITAFVGADGVHLGQDDVPIECAKAILGKSKYVGLSCHTFEDAQRAVRIGASYIGWGPIFKTTTKPQAEPIGLELVEKVGKMLKIPVFCIGGINLDNIREALDAGAKSVAISSAIICQRIPRISAQGFKRILENKDDAVRVCQK